MCDVLTSALLWFACADTHAIRERRRILDGGPSHSAMHCQMAGHVRNGSSPAASTWMQLIELIGISQI